MAKIYQRAEDKNVATNVIYFTIDGATNIGGDHYAYSVIDLTKKMTKDELYKAFVNGCVAADLETNRDGGMIRYYKVTKIEDGTNYFKVSFLVMVSGEVKEIELYSSEYVAS